jgi:hypothetical protein
MAHASLIDTSMTVFFEEAIDYPPIVFQQSRFAFRTPFLKVKHGTSTASDRVEKKKTRSGRPSGPAIASQWRCAVQYPEHRSIPEWPLQVPWPELAESLPAPEAYLSWTVTKARTEPEFAT